MSWDNENTVSIEKLIGKTITKIEGAEKYSEKITIHTDDGYIYTMYHDQDCCESVSVEDITGDIEDIIGRVITEASEISQANPHARDSGTWTFYKLSARHYGGGVCIRWNGESNGYYSERVDIDEEYVGGGITTHTITTPVHYALQFKNKSTDYWIDISCQSSKGTKEEFEAEARRLSEITPKYDFRVVERQGGNYVK